VASLIFRKGLDLKTAVAGMLAETYHSEVIEQIKADDFTYRAGRLTVHLAREFGFCYGVDRAVDYAYQTRRRFPDRHVFLTGEIIHNPHVNEKLRSMDVQFLSDDPAALDRLTPDDVVILPAFGVTKEDFDRLREIGCVLVDTTCGSVLNVWKRVESYARDGFTAIIHGKHYHEETKATASQVTKFAGGRYLVVLDMAEARVVCDFIERGGDSAALAARFGGAVSPGFDFDRDLVRVGIANQTTMLSGESLAIADQVRASMARRYGPEAVPDHFRSFDTICSATQERQDAVLALLDQPLDLMIVVGGYNSSNTCHLAALVRSRGVPVYHIEDAGAVDGAARTLRHQPIGTKDETLATDWLGEARIIGITAGASTPNNKIGETIVRICQTAGVELDREDPAGGTGR
jgi:4-hydroxy-3-methylbut-2-enyl diphosphate reductase